MDSRRKATTCSKQISKDRSQFLKFIKDAEALVEMLLSEGYVEIKE
jgi:hypothetical protein